MRDDANNETPKIERVLVVDDERDIRTVADMALATIAGWKTQLAENGEQALKIAAGEHFDVVLLDMMMPGKDGLATLQELRTLPGWATTPVIMVTAKAQRHEIRSYIEAGAAGVITKPFDPMTLAQRVRDLVAKAMPSQPKQKPSLASQLAALKAGYVAKLPAKVDEIRDGLERWISRPDERSYHAVRTPTHKLHGTAGSYDLPTVSVAAGALEGLILAAGPEGEPDDEALRGALTELQDTISRALDDIA